MARRVLHVRCVTGFGGGPDKTIINSPRYYPAFGYQGFIAFLHPPEDPGIQEIKRRVADAKCEAFFIEDRGPMDFSVVRKLAAIAREYRIDLWQSHDDKTNVLGLLVKRHRRMKLVSMGHGWGAELGLYPWKYWFYRNCSRLAYRFYDGCIAVSKDIDEMFISWGVPENRRFYVPNAIDTDYFIRSRDQRQARNLLGIQPTGDFLIGALGRLAPEKGFDRLIKAVHRLRNSGLMFDLWIAGEGGMRNELQSMISAMGLEDSVRLLGHQKDPRLFLESLDGFVLSSLREGLPNVILEALSMGTPVVSTKVAGVPGVITHREEGLLIDVDDTDAMVASIAELAQSGFLRENLIKKGRQLMVDRFNFSDRMRKVCDVYNTLLK